MEPQPSTLRQDCDHTEKQEPSVNTSWKVKQSSGTRIALRKIEPCVYTASVCSDGEDDLTDIFSDSSKSYEPTSGDDTSSSADELALNNDNSNNI